MTFPLGSHLADVQHLADADANVCLYRESSAAAVRGARPAVVHAPIGLHATTKFLRALGEILGLDPEPFIEREKHTTIKPIWDLWRSVTQDSSAPRASASSPARPTRAACAASSPTRWDCPATSRCRAAPARRPTTRRSARRCRRGRRWCCSELQRADVRGRGQRPLHLHPRVVPGRHRAPATPARRSWATRAPPTSCRRCATRCSTRCSHPAAGHRPRSRRGHARAPERREQTRRWEAEAQRLLADLVPPRRCWCRSRARSGLRDRAERDAQRAGEEVVTVARVAGAREALRQGRSGMSVHGRPIATNSVRPRDGPPGDVAAFRRGCPRRGAARGIGRKAGSSGADRMAAEKSCSISGLTDEEAQEFHKFWVQGFVGSRGGRRRALPVWAWRPGSTDPTPRRVTWPTSTFRRGSSGPSGFPPLTGCCSSCCSPSS